MTVGPNGVQIARTWLIYSPTTGCVYCFACKLLSGDQTSALAGKGFDSWTHIDRLVEHERSAEHREALLGVIRRLSKSQTLDKEVVKEFESERSYWREVLKRIVSTLKFLTARGLALRGDTEVFGSSDNGNFLGCLELLAEYDPFIAGHIQRYGNAGTTSYLSSNTYEEFVALMANKVSRFIVDELKEAKYFSFSVDSTPDIANVDQLTFTVRYLLNDGKPVERFQSSKS